MEIIPPLSVVSDNRRTLKNILKTDIKDINVCKAKKGSTLGNHYHKLTREYFYIFSGTCIVFSGNNSHIVNKDSTFMIDKEIKHSIKCLTDLTYISFLTEPFDESKPDIYK